MGPVRELVVSHGVVAVRRVVLSDELIHLREGLESHLKLLDVANASSVLSQVLGKL